MKVEWHLSSHVFAHLYFAFGLLQKQGQELFALQGLFISDLENKVEHTDSQLGDLAGNSFLGLKFTFQFQFFIHQ